MKTVLSLSVNGTTRDDVIPDNMLLVDYLRENIGLTGTKVPGSKQLTACPGTTGCPPCNGALMKSLVPNADFAHRA